MTFCRDQCIVKTEDGAHDIHPLKCKCWSCEDCRPDRIKRLTYEARRGNPTLFITITSKNVPAGDPSAAAREMVRAWRIIRAEHMKAKGLDALPFLAVFEETKRGWPHIHIVARCKWLDQGWLAKRMGELTGSPICWVERLTSARKVAKYVTKYIGKNPHRFNGTKRYWRSLDYLTPDPEQEETKPAAGVRWERIDCNWLKMATEFELVGFHVTMFRTHAHAEPRAPP